MRVIRSKDFTATRAWEADDIANMDGTTVRLHWTDQPYKWHVNDGEEVFAVLDGTVDMHYRESGIERVVTLAVSEVFFRRGWMRTCCASSWRSADSGDRT